MRPQHKNDYYVDQHLRDQKQRRQPLLHYRHDEFINDKNNTSAGMASISESQKLAVSRTSRRKVENEKGGREAGLLIYTIL